MNTSANQFSRQISYAKIIDCSLMFCLLVVGVSSLSRGTDGSEKTLQSKEKTKTNFSLKLARPTAQKKIFTIWQTISFQQALP